MQNNTADDLTVAANTTTFTFATKVSGSYAVTVKTQPTGQNCTVSNGSGTASSDITNVNVTCSVSSYSIGGTITGLTADGLVLQNNTADDLTVAANATTFTFPTKVSGAYSVTVKTQPTGLTCTVSNESGTATADVSDVAVVCAATCSGTSITRNWGTFCDMKDGTVKLVVTAGTFGGNTYTAKTLYFAKCSHGQTYDSSGNTCSAAGTATQVQYCNATNTTCQAGGANDGILDGSGTSGAYTACSGLSLASKSWRVPTKDELKLLINCNTTTEMPNDGSACSASTDPAINKLFPNTLSSDYWSSSGNSTDSAYAWRVAFNNGYTSSSTDKMSNRYVRCVSE